MTERPGAGGAREKLHDPGAGFAVAGGGGLVADDQAGLVDEGPGDGDALLLAARRGGRGRCKAFSSMPTVFSGQPSPFLRLGTFPTLLDQERHADVIQAGQRRNEVELLEDEPDVGPPELGDPARPESRGAASRKPSTCPLSKESSVPATTLRRVVLPQPEGPTTMSNPSPVRASKSTSFRAWTRASPAPKLFETRAVLTAIFGVMRFRF